MFSRHFLFKILKTILRWLGVFIRGFLRLLVAFFKEWKNTKHEEQNKQKSPKREERDILLQLQTNPLGVDLRKHRKYAPDWFYWFD